MIITIFLLSLGGCGYKKDPYLLQQEYVEDENVEFIQKSSYKSEE